jgi:hypothetical protein
MNLVRAMSSEGWGRIRYHTTIRRLLETDRSVRAYMEGETTVLPEFYVERIRRELGSMYRHLPDGAMYHDPNAYLNSTDNSTDKAAQPVAIGRGKRKAS